MPLEHDLLLLDILPHAPSDHSCTRLTLQVSKYATVADLKNLVAARWALPPSKRLRLIWRGQLLQDTSPLHTYAFNTSQPTVIHCSISDLPSPALLERAQQVIGLIQSLVMTHQAE